MARLNADGGMTPSMSIDVLENMFIESDSLYSDPEKYLEPTDSMRKDVLSLTKKMYDFMMEYDVYSNQNSLKELLVSGFDNEQIWQEIQLQNNPCLSKVKSCLKGLDVESVKLINSNKTDEKAKKNPAKNKKTKAKNSSKITKEVNPDENINDGDEDILEEEESMEPKRKYKKTIVDDEFFKLREMEEYMDKLDRLEDMKNNEDVLGEDNDDSDDEIDFFKENLASSDEDDEDDDDNDEKTTTLQYNDFFDSPTKTQATISTKLDEIQNVTSNDNDISCSDSEEDQNSETEGVSDNDSKKGEDGSMLEGNLSSEDDIDDNQEIEEENGDGKIDSTEEKIESTFERKQRIMEGKIKKLEEENINEKPWQLMGEADAKKRPVNSLLEEFVTFDVTSVGAPVITEETTLSLEDLIKQRIKDKAWDDVIRKEKPLVQPYEYKKAPELNQEKSKLSLAEVYEKEYLKQAEDDKEEKENEEHVNIQKLMDRLFVQLDALSNFHFTPKPPQPEIKIITNVPSIQMEEVLPITMSDASQLAPEEVFEKKKGELVNDAEKTNGDRKRNRRQKKIKKKFSAKERERKEKLKGQKAGKIAKSERKQAMDSLKKGVRNTILNSNKIDAKSNIKSSNEFFNKLQNEVKSNISKENMKSKTSTKKTKSAEFLKL